MKKEVLIWIALAMLLVPTGLAQTAHEFQVENVPFLEMYLYSWGQGQETKINLDDYFSVRRAPGEKYVASAPTEIAIAIDQETGIATLTPNIDWTGTRRIVFIITAQEVTVEEALGKLKAYEEKEPTPLEKEEILRSLQEELSNSTNYEIVKKLIEKLENELGPEAKVTASKENKLIKLSVGESVDLDVGFEDKLVNNIRTEKPKIALVVTPVGTGGEEIQEDGTSLLLIVPVIFIILSMLLVGIFYAKDHYSTQIKRFFSKFEKKSEEIEIEKSNYLKIKRALKEIENVKDADAFFEIIKEFFKACVQQKYSGTYSGLSQEIMLDSLDNNLKGSIIKLSKEISDLKFSGREVDNKQIKKLASISKGLIEQVLSKKKRYLISKEKQVSFIVKLINLFQKKELKSIGREVKKATKEVEKERRLGVPSLEINKILRGFGFKTQFERIKDKIKDIKENKRKDEEVKKRKEAERRRVEKEKERLNELKKKEKERKKREIKNSFKHYLHNLGLYKTDKEILNIKRAKYLEKARKDREKELARHEKEAKKRRKEREKQEKKEEKKEERKKKFREFLHKIGLYKTSYDVKKEKIESTVEKAKKTREKHRKEEENKRKKEERKRKLRKFLHDKFGLYKTDKEITDLKREKALEKARKVRTKQIEEKEAREKEKERKKTLRNFLHDKLGFYRTPAEKEEIKRKKAIEELKKEKEKEGRKEELKIKEKEFGKKFRQEEEKLKEGLASLEEKSKEESKIVKRKLASFIHNKLKLFRSPEEKIKDLERERQKREENIRKLKTNFLKDQIQKLKGEDLHPDKKIEILEEELKKALRRGDTKLASRIDKQIDSLYQQLPREKKKKTKQGIFSKLKEKLKSTKYNPEYRDIKEKIIHPGKEKRIVKEREEHIKELAKQTKEFLERGDTKKAESFYSRTFDLLRGAEHKIKREVEEDIDSIMREKKKVSETTQEIEEDIRERFKRASAPPRIQISKIKSNTEKIEKIISEIKINLRNRNAEKAKRLYEKANQEFKKIPEDVPETTHQRLYSQLRPLKNEILQLSLPALLGELKRDLRDEKVEKARKTQEQIDEIYAHIGRDNKQVFESDSISSMIREANNLVNKNKEEAKEVYKKIMIEYDSLPELAKKKHYPKIRDLYLKIIR